MLNNARHKEFLLFCRIQNMEAMKMALKIYQETKEEEFYDWAVKLGEWSKYYKKEIEQLR